MSAAKHTPGPWPIERGSSGRFIKAIGPCSADEYAGSAWLEVSAEDARLIAAAPELLEALQAVCSHGDRSHTQIAADWDRARAAIAKATKEQP